VAVDVASGSLADAQTRIDAARNANPGAVLVISMSGTYTVTGSPLRLPSLSSLTLQGTIRAGSGATASTLISINGQDRVAVAGGTLDGGNANLNGVAAVDAQRINVDKVTIVNTGREAIWLDGTGTAVTDAGASIVRCDISAAGANAIVIRERMQALVVDNNVHDNAGTGVQVLAAHSVVTNNTVQRNATGIQVDGTDNAVSKNNVTGNGTGIRLSSAATNNSVFQNTVTSNTASGIALGGSNNMLYSNALSGNAPNFTNGGSANYIVPDTISLVAPGNNYFHPPTINNRHTNTTIVNGRGRRDLNINGTTLANVQSQYNSARTANPNDVIVLNLTGTFTHSGASLTLQSFTAVVLNGTINTTSSASGPAIKGAAGSSFISVSGGTIEGNGKPAPGVQLPTVMAVVDRVTVHHWGEKTPRSSGGAIHLSGNGGYGIVRGCRVDVTGGRCIWTQSSGKRYLVLDNHSSNCNMDGIDFDSHTANSIARGNRCEDSVRYGLFIEEGAARNKAWDNDLNRNEIGVNLYAFASGPTERNSVFMNRIGGNARGVRNGSQAEFQTRDNFIFNNTLTGNATALQDQAPAEGNYFSQNVLSGNTTDVSVVSSAATSFFNSLAAPVGGATPTPTPTATSTTPGPTPTPTPTPTGGFSGYYRLMARHSGKAVVVEGASTANGANVLQWTYGGANTNDEWQLVNLGDGYYRIVNRNSGKVLDVAQAGTANATNVQQWEWGNVANQQWQISDLGNGYHRLTARHSGKVLNVSGAGTGDGANVDQWSWANVNQQQFQIIQVP
jgi:parallel beta-helix repeat protein